MDLRINMDKNFLIRLPPVPVTCRDHQRELSTDCRLYLRRLLGDFIEQPVSVWGKLANGDGVVHAITDADRVRLFVCLSGA